MNSCKVLAGIITYNPDIGRLNECINSVLAQIDDVLVIDNHSDNYKQIKELLKINRTSIHLKTSNRNNGIACALSELMNHAYEMDYDYVLTMDHDSILLSGIVDRYISTVHKIKDVGMLTCLINDRNYYDRKMEFQNAPITSVKCAITSGCFINVDAYKKTGGYDKSFFIDYVDTDICYSLREEGYSIYRLRYNGLLHEDGKGENRRFFGKQIVVYNKAPSRIYYQSRNLLRLYKKHKEYRIRNLLKDEMSILYRIILYENNKFQRLKMFIKGLIES